MTDGSKEEKQTLGVDHGEWSIARMYSTANDHN